LIDNYKQVQQWLQWHMLTAVACREWARKIASISTLAMAAALSDLLASIRTDTGYGLLHCRVADCGLLQGWH
jgi:hypothetical protein